MEVLRRLNIFSIPLIIKFFKGTVEANLYYNTELVCPIINGTIERPCLIKNRMALPFSFLMLHADLPL